MRLMRITRWFAIAPLVALACGSGETLVAPPTTTLAVAGRAERGSVVRVGVRVGTDTTLQAVTGITLSPADAGTVLTNGDVRLTRTGSVIISAIAAGSTLTTTITISAPPVIVFDGLAGGNRDIYRVAIDGGELARLTTNVASDQYPTASGATVLFTSFRDGNGELYTASSTDGLGERRISNTTFNETQAALSPDGRKILYANNATGFSKIFLAPFDPAATTPLGTPARLTSLTFGAAGIIESTPQWGSASDRAVLMTTATPSGGAGLFTTAATAGATPALVTGSGTSVVEVEPSLNADGFLIAYASPAGSATEIFVRDTRTNAATQITRNGGSNGQPAFLPDGRLVYTTFAGGASTLSWVDPAKPTDIHPITTTGLSVEHAAPVRP